MFGWLKKKQKPKSEIVWELVATNDHYHVTDENNNKTFYEMRFYQSKCGKRKYTSNYPSKRYHPHKGMEKARQNWLDAGVIPVNSIHPTKNKNYTSVADIKREEIDPVLAYQQTLDDIAKSLKVVINRDFDLEDKYPKLKDAADEYHRVLEKYRTFELLKDENKDE